MKGVPFLNKTYIKGAPFLTKCGYKRIRGWNSGQSLPVLNFVKYPPPPGLLTSPRNIPTDSFLSLLSDTNVPDLTNFDTLTVVS